MENPSTRLLPSLLRRLRLTRRKARLSSQRHGPAQQASTKQATILKQEREITRPRGPLLSTRDQLHSARKATILLAGLLKPHKDGRLPRARRLMGILRMTHPLDHLQQRLAGGCKRGNHRPPPPAGVGVTRAAQDQTLSPTNLLLPLLLPPSGPPAPLEPLRIRAAAPAFCTAWVSPSASSSPGSPSSSLRRRWR
jgi:hypothetical protein